MCPACIDESEAQSKPKLQLGWAEIALLSHLCHTDPESGIGWTECPEQIIYKYFLLKQIPMKIFKNQNPSFNSFYTIPKNQRYTSYT